MFNITRDNKSYNHKFVIKLKNGSIKTIATLPVGQAAFEWEPTFNDVKDIITLYPSASNVTVTVTLYTYNGTKEVGWYANYLNLKFRESDLKPSISVRSYTDTSGCLDKYGCLVSGKSSLVATFNTELKCGSHLKHIDSEFLNKKIVNTALSSPINFTINCDNPGGKILKTTIYDSRNFSSEVTKNFYVNSYIAPYIENVDIIRCDSNGNPSESGMYCKVWISYKSCRLGISGEYNKAKIKISYGKSTETSRTEMEAETSTASGETYSYVNGIELNTSYDFDISIYDDFSTYSVKSVFSNKGTIIEISSDGETLIIGDASAGNIKFSSTLVEIRYGQKVLASFGTTAFTYEIPTWMSGNCNNFRKTGIYYMGNSVTNKPGSGLNGWLEVMGYSTTNIYQRFTTYTGATYVRFYNNGTWSSWKSVYSAT